MVIAVHDINQPNPALEHMAIGINAMTVDYV